MCIAWILKWRLTGGSESLRGLCTWRLCQHSTHRPLAERRPYCPRWPTSTRPFACHPSHRVPCVGCEAMWREARMTSPNCDSSFVDLSSCVHLKRSCLLDGRMSCHPAKLPETCPCGETSCNREPFPCVRSELPLHPSRDLLDLHHRHCGRTKSL